MVYVVWLMCGWSDYGRGFTVLCFDSSNLFQIKSKFEEKINIQTEENEVVLREDF